MQLRILQISAGLLFTLSVVSCQTTAPLRAKMELIAPYQESEQAKEKFDAPYVATYSRLQKTLKFIAAAHENKIESPTFRTIDSVIEEFKPQIMILEGFENKNEISPNWYIEHAKKCNASGYSQCGEPAYSAFLAQEKKIPFVAGEPRDSLIFEKLIERGYTKEDFIGFYLVRYIPQWRRQKVLSDGSLERRIERVAKWILKDTLGLIEPYTWNQFQNWYRLRMKSAFDPSAITNDSVSPQVDNNPTFLNQMAHEVGMIRERHLVSVIEAMLNQHNRVLVIYGSGHLVKQRAVLNDLFGPSIDEKLY